MTTLTTNYLAPTGREEAWRFTPLSRLQGLHDRSQAIVDHSSLEGHDLPVGVTISTQPSIESPALSITEDAGALNARSVASQVRVLTIAAQTSVTDPIILKRNSLGDKTEGSRFKIVAGNHSKATIVIENIGRALLTEDIEILLEPGSHLTFITLQEWENSSIHLGRHHAIVGKDASFTSVVVTIGGSLVRLLPTVEYAGSGSSAEMYGLYFAGSGQHLEHRIHVDHNVGHAKSRVNYKGALSGESARTVWIGDVFIRAAAEGTDTYELNRNLLLSDGARADSVPNLEIETGDIVGAGHASTTGRFDDEQLFYLQSRGIPESEAKRLVIRGFFLEILSKIGIEAIEDRIMTRIDAELTKVVLG